MTILFGFGTSCLWNWIATGQFDNITKIMDSFNFWSSWKFCTPLILWGIENYIKKNGLMDTIQSSFMFWTETTKIFIFHNLTLWKFAKRLIVTFSLLFYSSKLLFMILKIFCFKCKLILLLVSALVLCGLLMRILSDLRKLFRVRSAGLLSIVKFLIVYLITCNYFKTSIKIMNCFYFSKRDLTKV